MVCYIAQGDHNKLAGLVAAKLEDGNLRAAGRILSSEDSPAQPSLDGPAKLQTLTCSFVLLWSAIARSLSAFGGGWVWRTEDNDLSLQVQQVVQTAAVHSTWKLISCRDSGQDILTDLTAFVNMVVAGRCPKSQIPLR